MSWWIWVAFGLVLMVAEMLAPGGFDALFLGLAAVVVGLLVGAGLIEAPWGQWALYSVLAVAWLLVLRRPLRARFARQHGGGEVDTLVGETALPLEELGVGATGKAELRGTAWTARNASTSDLRRGQRCRVVRVDGLTIWLEAE